MIGSTEGSGVSAAFSRGDAKAISSFLYGLLSGDATRGAAEINCLKMAVSVMNKQWRSEEEDVKERRTKRGKLRPYSVVGDSGLTPDLFGNVVSYLGDREALRNTTVNRAWWRAISILPVAEHINLRLKPWVGWQNLLKQLKHINSTNPRRAIRRLTFRVADHVSSLRNLAIASGGLLTYIDFGTFFGSLTIDLRELGRQMPGLKGIALSGQYYSSEASQRLIPKLTTFLEDMPAMESLCLRGIGDCATMFSNQNLKMLAKAGDNLKQLNLSLAVQTSVGWITEGIAAIGDAMPVLEELVIDHVHVTDEGWKKFARARVDAGHLLRCLAVSCQKARGGREGFEPSFPAISLLARAVTDFMEVGSEKAGYLRITCPSKVVRGKGDITGMMGKRYKTCSMRNMGKPLCYSFIDAGSL